jgi:hypothetical protein
MNSILRTFAVATCSGVVIALTLSGAARAITDTVFRYSTPKTGYLTLHPVAFTIQASSMAFVVLQDTAISPEPDGCLGAPVNLPHGATITAVTFWMTTGDPDPASVRMFRTRLQTGANEYLFSENAPNHGGVRRSFSLDVPDFNVINNAQYAYGVVACMINNPDALHGVRVTYTYSNAGD